MNRSPRKWALAAGLGLVVLVLSVVAWIQAVAIRRAKQMDARIDALLEEARADSPARPMLRGEALPGNAWDEYGKAFQEIDRCKGRVKIVSQSLDPNVKTDPEEVARCVRDLAPIVDLLRAGTRRATATFPGQWARANEIDTPSLVHGNWMGNLGVATALAWQKEGRRRDAAELLLDVCRFGGDFHHNSILINRWIGEGIRSQAIGALKDLVSARTLTDDDLREVGRELEILDRDTPPDFPYFRNEVIMAGLELRKSPERREEAYQVRFWRRWRYGFSDAILSADALFRVEEAFRVRASGHGKPWPEARAAHQAFGALAADERNPLAHANLNPPDDVDFYVRRGQAQLRMLCAAVSFMRTGSVPTLGDPYGDTLKHRTEGGRLKIWSRGPDGVDDGGSGEWNPRKGRDIVLEVER